MLELQKRLKEAVEPAIDAHQAFLIDIVIQQGHRRKIVRIFADTDAGITIQECADISRAIAKILDEQNLIEGSFDLEVSSPGLERPLRLLRQYAKNIGRTLHIRYRVGDEIKTVEGNLESIRETVIELSNAQSRHEQIEFDQIVEARVKLPW